MPASLSPPCLFTPPCYIFSFTESYPLSSTTKIHHLRLSPSLHHGTRISVSPRHRRGLCFLPPNPTPSPRDHLTSQCHWHRFDGPHRRRIFSPPLLSYANESTHGDDEYLCTTMCDVSPHATTRLTPTDGLLSSLLVSDKRKIKTPNNRGIASCVVHCCCGLGDPSSSVDRCSIEAGEHTRVERGDN